MTPSLQIPTITDKRISQTSENGKLGPHGVKMTNGHKRSLLRKKGKRTNNGLWVKKETENPAERQAKHKKPAKNKHKKLPNNPSLQEIANLQESRTTVQQNKEKIIKDPYRVALPI
ncbi:hypothetical protein HanRHA438_Chr12g0559441 [Helianthus annuus]|nr:hypothetical protein HanRHA438_Chr12g0559441 [Helianthus annuus]